MCFNKHWHRFPWKATAKMALFVRNVVAFFMGAPDRGACMPNRHIWKHAFAPEVSACNDNRDVVFHDDAVLGCSKM